MCHTCDHCGHHHRVIVAVSPRDWDDESFEVVSSDRDLRTRRNRRYFHDHKTWKSYRRTQYRPVLI